MKPLKLLFNAIFGITLLLALASCRTSKMTIEEQTDIREYELWQQRMDEMYCYTDSLLQVINIKDSIASLHERIDSTFHRTIQNDTLMLRDSISVTVLGDGSTITDRYHRETRIVAIHDTLNVLRNQKDYLYEYQQEQAYTEHLTAVNIKLHEEIEHLRDSLSKAISNQETTTTIRTTPFRTKVAVCLLLIMVSLLMYRFFDKQK